MSQATLSSEPYLNSNLFSGYYLDERIADLDEWDCDDEAGPIFEELRQLWEAEGPLVQSYKEDELLDSWIDEVLDILGFGTLSGTTLPNGGGYNDRLLFDSTQKRREAVFEKRDGRQEAMYDLSSALLEAKRWDASFEKQFNKERPYRDASHQIKHYLERTPESVQWGILTNGRKWRLYGTKEYETQTYYEIDLPELLESGSLQAFKYFYIFFRPAAFRKSAGTTFLDEVWNESETAARELGEDLQDNVFTALRVLGEGFVETNDLDIDPEDGDQLNQLKEQSLVLLYRLMFALYAEARHLIDPDDFQAQTEYKENFSLSQRRLEIIGEVGEAATSHTFEQEYSEYSTAIWSRLENLFSLINTGNESLGIPPYNGGLFNEDRHSFLTDNEVADRYIAEVIYRLSTTETDEGFVPADYADLDTRHLGSIYEGLLEHQFRIAPTEYDAVVEDGDQIWRDANEVTVADAVETVEEGGLYVVNDDGERKATGAYYTPDYVVSYIVEESINPLIEEIEGDLAETDLQPGTEGYVVEFWDRVTDLSVLDPAMGSGHFLTKATGYLAEQVMEQVRKLETATLFSEQQIRREVSRECIYGVDLNGMAVELAKLSMWLETLATDQPLAFLDHHLKTGNSLVGSDITDVLSNGEEPEEGQITLTQAFAQVRRNAVEHVMDLMGNLLAIDNETLEDVKSMEEIYAEIRADPLYQRLFSIANVHTAERFGVKVPSDAYKRMAQAIEESDTWAEIKTIEWFQEAQDLANEERFFQWELEFPEVFFGENGRKTDQAGFDAVVSNPPYIRIQNFRQIDPNTASYLTTGEDYTTTEGRFDVYAPFVERGSQLAAEGRLCYILPNKFVESGGGKPLRGYLLENNLLSEVVDFGQYQIFQDATTYTCILSLYQSDSDLNYVQTSGVVKSSEKIRDLERVYINLDEFSDKPWVLTGPQEQKVLGKIKDAGEPVNKISQQILQGMKSGDNAVLFVEVLNWDETVQICSPANNKKYEVESELIEPIVLGDGIGRYEPPKTDLGVIYPYDQNAGQTTIIPEDQLEEHYPLTYAYLSDFRERLTDRRSEHMRYEKWYALNRPRTKCFFESPKIIVPDICQQSEFTIDDRGEYYIGNTGYGIVPTDNTGSVRRFLLAVLNSSTTWFYIYQTSTVLENDFRRFLASYLGPLPIPQPDLNYDSSDDGGDEEALAEEFRLNDHVSKAEKPGAILSVLAGELTELHADRSSLNLSLLDHLDNYDEDGPAIAETGFTQPPKDVANSILQETTETRGPLRIGEVTIEHEISNSVTIRLTARYKPENEDAYEVDQYGYTETDPLPALRITDLSETEADLIEAFVPVAVDKAGGFANFRENATKTNSLIDRLKALTLPDPNDVSAGLKSYQRTEARTEELDEKIERTDRFIDEIVYELYGLTDEEIEIVEEAVS